MKRFIINIICALLTLNGIAQEYSLPRVQTIKTVNVEASSETITAAWFYPEGEFLNAKQFDKVEIGFELPASVQHKIEAYFRQDNSVADQINPFNRHRIDITCELVLNGGKERTVDAFYYEEFARDLRMKAWKRDSTSFPFRVRVSPKGIGNYVLKVNFKASGIQTTNFEILFNVTASDHKGLLEKGTNNRHMRFSKSKESFFGVGQVIPWTEWNSWADMPKASAPGQFMPFYTALHKMDEAGGNFTRFVAAPWFMQLEWEALGNYQPKMGHAWEFDRINDLCNEAEIYFIFCALLHGPLQERTDAEQDKLPGIRWETYCYNDADKTRTRLPQEPRLGLSKPIDFYTNERAFDLQQNYFRYLVSRWGYSPALAGWQLMSEADDTGNYRDRKDEDGNIIDNSESRMAVNRWNKKVSEYMEYECGDDHLKSISFIVGKHESSYLWDPEIYQQKEMDYLGLHDYIFETEKSYHIRNRNLIKRYETVSNLSVGLNEGSIDYPEFQKKLYIFDEFGHVTIIPVQWPEDKNDYPSLALNNCMDFNFKQDLWFTLSSGCAVAGLDWWNEREGKRQSDWKRFFPPMQSFMENVDFEKVDYTTVREHKNKYYIAQRWPFDRDDVLRSNTKSYRKSDKLEAYTQLDSAATQGFGWMMNRSYHWYNLKDSLECIAALLNGTEPFAKPYLYESIDNDVVDTPLTIEEGDAFIKVYNVKKRKRYTVDFYNTLTGKVTSSKEIRSSMRGMLKIYPPTLNPKDQYDIAYKFYETSEGWK